MDKEVYLHIHICIYLHISIHIYTYIYLHACNRIPLSHKKELNFAICDNMDLEGIMLSEISYTEKEKYQMISFIYGI